MDGDGEFLASNGALTRPTQIADEQRVKAALAAGAVIGFPTETVWGLCVAAGPASFLGRLRHRKERPADKAFQVLCADSDAALALVEEPGRLAALAALWPGPLTLVARAGPKCPPWLAPGSLVGLRVPDHPVAQRLAALAGGQLVSSSLNRSGEPPATDQAAAEASGLADLLIAGDGARGLASTVFDTVRGRVVRVGAFPAERLLEAWACGR